MMRIEPKYNLGDIVYFLRNNAVNEAIVGKINIFIDERNIEYWVALKGKAGWVGATLEFPEYPEYLKEKDIFKTKEELIASL